MPSVAEAEASPTDARVGEILDWLARPAAADLDRELRQTHDGLGTFAQLPLSINQFHRILDLFQSRADSLAAELKRRLRKQDQPPPRELRHLAYSLDALENRICDAYLRILKDIEHRLVRNRRRDPGAVSARALKALRDRLELAAYIAKPAPAQIWACAHRLYRGCVEAAEPASSATHADVGRLYREILAFAAIQPERLSAVEVGGAIEYLGRFAPTVVLLDQAPPAADYRLFWIDTSGDTPPIALARRQPAQEQKPLYFSCVRLGTLAAEHLMELEAGTAPTLLQLPADAAQAPFRGLLHKLHEAWAEPPTRHLPRKAQTYQVSMLAGLETLVRLFDIETGGQAPPADSASLWNVINESPSGYALRHTGGSVEGIKTGEVVAVRSAQDKPWDVCVVRRALSEDGETLELGLQVIASNSSARAVRVAFRHAPAPQDAMPALWLPAVGALRPHDAILIPSGAAGSQRFVMAANDGRIRVCQGRVVDTSLRTASVELLEYQDDPYPL